MRIVHRFYDLLVGGAEVVILNTVKALPQHEHVLLFSRATRNWVYEELSELENVTLLQIEAGCETQTICNQNADLYCFHYYPPMCESDFRDLPSRVLHRSLLVNHWYKEVPLVHGIRYIFLSNESRVSTGGSVPSRLSGILINPVAEKFFRIQRQEIECSVGRHSRDADFKFADDFFGVHESIRNGELNVLVLGAPKEMQQYLSANLPRLKNNYFLLGFGSMRVPAFLRLPQIYFYQTREDFAETCPMNILEAMAAGIPIIAESKGGIGSLVSHQETGILCSSREQYIDSCHTLFENADQRRNLGNAAQQWARENASIERFGERFLTATAELLSASIGS